MKLNEIEEKDEEELYESEFKEDMNFIKKLEEEEKYENEFNNGDFSEIEKLEEEQNNKKVENDVNLDDYKEIHESQKIQTQLNFFEDSIADNININRSKAHVVGNINSKMIQSNNNSNNFGQNEGVIKSNNLSKNSMNKSKQNYNNINNMESYELNDSFGDKILQNLNKYRKMALGENSVSQSLSGQK